MGYDLLESGDFFPTSRVKGNFADDKKYSEFLGIGRGKRRAKGEGEKIEEQFPDLSPKASCDQVKERIVELQAEMDIQRGKITAGDKSKWFRMSLGILETKLQKAKTLLSKLNCQKIQEELELKQQQEDILNTLSATTKESVSGQPSAGTLGGMNKYVVYGIGGLFVIGALVILLKPSK